MVLKPESVCLVYIKLKLANNPQKRIWCSGIIVPSHGTDRGSIPRMRIFFSSTGYICVKDRQLLLPNPTGKKRILVPVVRAVFAASFFVFGRYLHHKARKEQLPHAYLIASANFLPQYYSMRWAQTLSFLLGLSSLGLFTLLEMKKWHRRQIMEEKLRLISEALEQAEKTTIRFQERHDRILFQINSHYLCRREMEEALAGAQKAMNEALKFCVDLRQMQMKILASYSRGVDHAFSIMRRNYNHHS